VTPFEQTDAEGYREVWVDLRHEVVLGEGTDRPAERAVTIKDAAAYGLILTQGHGTLRRTAGLDAGDDPLRTDDGRRTVRFRRKSASGGQGRESQRQRSTRHPETFRPG
jgi:hypothetical protein